MHLTFAAIMLTGVALAQDVAVRSDHPDEYVVVKGDTLWDISGRFLDKPWQWPAIWHANPQIENPHLIYPGDVISLVYIDGVPQLRLSRGGADTVKLSPSIRIVDRDDAIQAIPFESIEPFVRDLRVLSPSEFEGLPYVIANQEDRMNATYSDTTYVRGLEGARVGEEYVVGRLMGCCRRNTGGRCRTSGTATRTFTTRSAHGTAGQRTRSVTKCSRSAGSA
jgi:hypothetical protein